MAENLPGKGSFKDFHRTLNTLRKNGIIPYSKIGGILLIMTPMKSTW